HDIGEAVAGAGDVAAAGLRQVLDIGAEREVDAALDEVGALAGPLRDDVAEVVDDVGVVAGATLDAIRAGPAVENVGASGADDVVGEFIAGAADRADAREGQVLDRAEDGRAVLRQAEGDGALHGVDAGAEVVQLVDNVADVVDDVGVAAVAADHVVLAD